MYVSLMCLVCFDESLIVIMRLCCSKPARARTLSPSVVAYVWVNYVRALRAYVTREEERWCAGAFLALLVVALPVWLCVPECVCA